MRKISAKLRDRLSAAYQLIASLWSSWKPRSLFIECIGLQTRIFPTIIDKDGYWFVPNPTTDIGWNVCAGSLKPSGNLQLHGHYDDDKGKPAAFFRLGEITIGQEIIVYGKTKSAHYRVTAVYSLEKTDPSVGILLNKQEASPTLTLITCAGQWDDHANDYEKRTIVRAVRLA